RSARANTARSKVPNGSTNGTQQPKRHAERAKLTKVKDFDLNRFADEIEKLTHKKVDKNELQSVKDALNRLAGRGVYGDALALAALDQMLHALSSAQTR